MSGPADTLPPPARALAVFRLGFGAVSLLAPAAAWRVAGADLNTTPGGALVARCFASRELMIGAGLAAGATAADRRRWLQLGVAVDTADALSAVVAYRRGASSTSSCAVNAGGALLAVALGVSALRTGG